MSSPIRYLVFDIESVADGPLVAKLRYPGESLTPAEGVAPLSGRVDGGYDSDFIPYTFQVPISVAVAKVAADFRLARRGRARRAAVPPARDHREFLARLGEVSPADARQLQRPHVRPAALGTGGVSLRAKPAGLVQPSGKSFEQFRNRFNLESHLDLQELLTNFGSTRFNGGLEPGGQLARQARQDGRARATWCRTFTTPASWPRSTTIAAATCWTRISFFCASRVLIGQLTIGGRASDRGGSEDLA